MVLSLMLCHIYNPMRRAVRDGQKKTLLFYIFQDCDAFFSLCTSFVTFILGFSNATIFQRWWRLRELCGTVNGKTVDTAVLLASYARRESDLDELFRLLWLAHALHVHSIHNSETDATLELLIQEGLLKAGDEAEALRHCNTLASSTPVSIVYGWFTKRFASTVIRDLPPAQQSGVLQSVQSNISAMRGAAADVLMYLSTPVPRAYTSLLEIMVTLYVLMAPLGLVPRLLWMAVPGCFIVTLIFYGFMSLGKQMLNPFMVRPHAARSDDAFDTQGFLIGTRAACREVAVAVFQSSNGSRSA
eukprot:CAMPEP_0119372344 /NCGR_PEP_ID=MMETSP1334-20130426/18347_1 /TAXON_ID=127549 /ORGANISM="Calcidiscus leptoporus, Strain RCC1130" /LENGTH=300 /DNA_ID=CAMNT_0007389807 /DNA_START=28 /DNA_END=930 /DNA_ORIENTATION=-